MKFALFIKLIPLCSCMIFSAVSFSQTNEATSTPFSSSSPFESSDHDDNKKNEHEEIFYDSVIINTPNFFDILSSPQRPFSSAVINNHSGGQNVDDPGQDSDAPIDDYIPILLLVAIICHFRIQIRKELLKLLLYIKPILNYKN